MDVTKLGGGNDTICFDLLLSAMKGYEMANQGDVTLSTTAQNQSKPMIEVEGLTAEYSTGCTPTGEWFALGTIVREGGTKATPAWVVVGTGTTMDEAVESLTSEMQVKASNYARI